MFGIKTQVLRYFTKKCVPHLINKTKITELMLHFKTDEFGHQASTQDADLGYGWIHYGLIRQQKPQKILCIGSRHGFIPATLAQACKDNGSGLVDFVDAGFDDADAGGWTGVGYWKTEAGKNCFSEFNLEKYINLYVKTTQQFVTTFPERSYDYIYIDGDHSLNGVLLDFKLLFPKLKKDGYIVFHDICVRGNKPEGEYGVWKLWKILGKKFKTIEINFDGSGLGIMQNKSLTEIQA